MLNNNCTIMQCCMYKSECTPLRGCKVYTYRNQVTCNVLPLSCSVVGLALSLLMAQLIGEHRASPVFSALNRDF
jgi:hypothetical protein